MIYTLDHLPTTNFGWATAREFYSASCSGTPHSIAAQPVGTCIKVFDVTFHSSFSYIITCGSGMSVRNFEWLNFAEAATVNGFVGTQCAGPAVPFERFAFACTNSLVQGYSLDFTCIQTSEFPLPKGYNYAVSRYVFRFNHFSLLCCCLGNMMMKVATQPL